MFHTLCGILAIIIGLLVSFLGYKSKLENRPDILKK